MRLDIQLINKDSNKSFRIKASQEVAINSFYEFLEKTMGISLTESDKKIVIFFITNTGNEIAYQDLCEKLNISKSSYYRAKSKFKKAKLFLVADKVIMKHSDISFIKYEYV
ncbi:MAG: hypothetical protein AB8G11_07835 [Saprospiraceae bacterium]